MNNKEFNKKCVDFLGWYLHWGFNVPSEDLIPNNNFLLNETNSYYLDELKFHNDWNWIHYLIGKINNKRELKYTVFQNEVDSVVPCITHISEITRLLIKNDKVGVVEKLNEYIDKFNLYKKK